MYAVLLSAALVFVAELGDKSQLMSMTFATRYRARTVIIGAGIACVIHAIIPGLFTETAGRTVERLHRDMLERRAAAADPEHWPDYEI